MRRIAVAASNYAGKYGSSACAVMEPTRLLYGICKFKEGGIRSIKTRAAAQKDRDSSAIVKKAHTAPRRLTSNKPKTAGRNSAGRITAFHRGGGSKRLYRKIDLKRNTPSIGVVERIEYDPNRSSNIALVRWSEGMHPLFRKKPSTAETFTPPSEILAPKEANIRGLFSFSSMSKETNQGAVSCFSTRPKATSVVVGLSTEPALSKGLSMSNYPGSKISINDVFLSAFSGKALGGPLRSSSSSVSLPRVAVAGAKPSFYAPVMRENGGVKNTFSLSEIKKWNSSSSVWAHRLKRKAAVSWNCSRSLHTQGLAGITELVKQKS